MVAEHLGALREQVVFVGGMVRGILVTDPAVPGPRPTRDVDLIVDIRSAVHRVEMNELIRAQGFKEDTSEDAPICRFVLRGVDPGAEDIPVDFMPLVPDILGFANAWYSDAFDSADVIETSVGEIRVIGAVHFVATKLESFAGRGANDFYHHDLEDIVVLLDGRQSFDDELASAAPDLREFIAQELSALLGESRFLSSLPGHLPPDAASQARLPRLLERMKALAGKQRATPVRSSNIRSFTYDSSSRELEVTFTSGGVYKYFDVPSEIFDAWKSASSAGRYHHRYIRGRYRYRRVFR